MIIPQEKITIEPTELLVETAVSSCFVWKMVSLRLLNCVMGEQNP